MVRSNEPTVATDERLFTTWFTSTADLKDHAVTDEEFYGHRPEPSAVCGVVVELGPMELAPRPRCVDCRDIIAQTSPPRPPSHGRRRLTLNGWFRPIAYSSSAQAGRQALPERAGSWWGSHKPPAEEQAQASKGDPAGEGASETLAPSPALFASGTPTVTSTRAVVAQLPAAALSAANPDSRDRDRQDARPRRVLTVHTWTPAASPPDGGWAGLETPQPPGPRRLQVNLLALP